MEFIVQFIFPFIVHRIPSVTIEIRAISQIIQLSPDLTIRLIINRKIAHIAKIAQIISNWKSLFCSMPEWLAQSFLDNILYNLLSNTVKLSIKA